MNTWFKKEGLVHENLMVQDLKPRNLFELCGNLCIPKMLSWKFHNLGNSDEIFLSMNVDLITSLQRLRNKKSSDCGSECLVYFKEL